MRRLAFVALFLASCSRQTPDNLYQRSRAFLDRGDFKDALAAAETGFGREPSWRFRLLKIEIELASGDAPAAMEMLASEPPSEPTQRARFHMFRGQAEAASSDFSAADVDLKTAAEYARDLHDPKLDAEIELRRGAVLTQTGFPEAAIEKYRSVFRLATQIDDLYLQAASLGNLGVQLLRSHHPDQAIYWLERARDVSERLGNIASVAKAIGNLGSCYLRLGELDLATRYLADAEARTRAAGSRNEQQIWLGNLGNVLLAKGDNTGARQKFAAALPIARDYGGNSAVDWLSNLAMLSISFHDFDAAERYNNEALERMQKGGSGFDANTRLNRARIAAGRGDEPAAETIYRGVIADRDQDPAFVIDAEAELAQLMIEKHDALRAGAQFRSALALIEHQQSSLNRDEYKLSYFSSLIRLYQDYVDFLVSNGEDAKALEIVESSRARVLDEKLHSGDKAERMVTGAGLEQIARSSHSALLSYWLAPERSFLWVITAAGIRRHDLPGEKKIASLVEAYGALVENLRDPLESESPAGRELAQTLLGPVQSLLDGKTRLILVPDRSLHSLNFETLPDPENPTHYVVERATIAVAPSLGLLANPRRAAAGGEKSILLVGDPDPAVDEFPRLPYAEKEIALIEQNFSPQSSVVMEGARANPAAYRDNDPARFRFIHFAAHAAANRESPLDSALILSRNQSGYALSARDVMNVPLHADLVTLSACRSAGARMYSGEGLVGLSWAFLRAGASNVVAGLWDVNDLSTANLMAYFYGQLAHGASPSAALREAKLRMLQQTGVYRKPFYWGPFQLYVGALN